MRIVSTDNYGGDYPDEKFLCWVDSKGKATPVQFYTQDSAELVARQFQDIHGPEAARFYMATVDTYVLKPGFEP